MDKYINNIPYKYILLLLLLIAGASCRKKKPEKIPLSFNPIKGISYTEVRRRLPNGLSFDDYGFFVEPSWKITFYNNDSASVWSPDKQKFLNFLVTDGQDSIFNVARSWFRLLKMSKDSLKLQVVQVEGDTLYWQQSKVFMTLYANSYLKNVLKVDPAVLMKPSRADTLFILKKTQQAKEIPDSAFAAYHPVTLTSTSSKVVVQQKIVTPDLLNNFDASEGYLNPEFNITINKAYENFSYSFTVLIDDKGGMHYGRSLIYMEPEFKESTTKVIKGIIDGYLKTYLKITPGTSLDIPHASVITLNVSGKKG